MSAATHQTTFKPNPIQRSFIESRSRADLFSSRMGEGKSTALCWAALYHTRHNPGASWALIRDTFENIVGTTQKTFFSWFPPGVFGNYHASKKTFTWAEGIAKGEVTFMGMDDQHDASKLMSREFAGFGIDEPAPAVGSAGVDELIFDIGLSRLRQPGMNWYCAKLAENNPDEAHWTYRRFVAPGEQGFTIWQPQMPENILNLPASYYAELRKTWAHRPDLIRRFVEGEFGFQQIGKSVTPQWNDKFHLSLGLSPIPRGELILCWDFGLNPTCVITQVTPTGHWDVLDAMCGDTIGVEQLIVDWVKPLLTRKYRGNTWRHTGDPMGGAREQSDVRNSAVRVIKKHLGGNWRAGPTTPDKRIPPLQAVLTRAIGGRGLVRVDRENAACVWHALRGGWHHHISRAGLVSGIPVKNEHSHPGDALSYGAAMLFPMGRLQENTGKGLALTSQAGYFNGAETSRLNAVGKIAQIGKPVAPGTAVPEHGAKLGE